MNVYDFDGTIYNGDSGVDFVKYMYAKKPLFLTLHMMKFSKSFLAYEFKKISFKEMKENLFSFVKQIDNLESYIDDFTNKKKDNIKKYYLTQRKEDDVIVSASLDFYLIPLCKKIGLNKVICTKYDIKSGKIIGENCKKDEKVKRFNLEFGENYTIENSYGDSKSDIPILKRAKNAFLIKDNNIVKYEQEEMH